MTTTALPTQAQVDEVAQELNPDVVRIRMQVGKDWSDDPALTFRVLLSDQASRPDRLADVTPRVSGHLSERLKLSELDHLSYFRFRSESEQAQMKGKQWE